MNHFLCGANRSTRNKRKNRRREIIGESKFDSSLEIYTENMRRLWLGQQFDRKRKKIRDFLITSFLRWNSPGFGLKIRPHCHLSWAQNRSECTMRLSWNKSITIEFKAMNHTRSSTKMLASYKIWSNFFDLKLIWGNQKHQKPVITAIQLTLARLFWSRACDAAKSSSNRLNGNVFNY